MEAQSVATSGRIGWSESIEWLYGARGSLLERVREQCVWFAPKTMQVLCLNFCSHLACAMRRSCGTVGHSRRPRSLVAAPAWLACQLDETKRNAASDLPCA